MILRLILLSLCLASVNVVAEEKTVLCYYGTWATYRSGLGKFDVENIDPNLCTHLIYTFAGIDDQGTVISLDPYLDFPDNWGRDNFRKFNGLKKTNPKLKTILAVGGWNEGSAKYSTMAADSQRRKNFINSTLDMIRTYGFDGLDLDWEYPNQRDTVHGQADIDNFTTLLKELKDAFEPFGLLLMAAVAAVEEKAVQSYNIPTMAKYLDLINIMAYDMYGAWDPVTGHNAALHKSQGDEGKAPENLYTVDVALKYWLNQGCPPEKLVLGLPFYGRTFTLTDPNQNGVRAPSSGEGIAGPFTATNGFIGYNEFCSRMLTESWDKRFDDLGRVPYAVRERNWVSYDSPESLIEKVDYGSTYGIAGYMVWSIETDDFHGICHGETFPLLKALNRALGRSVVPVLPASTSPKPPTEIDTTPVSSINSTAGIPTTSSPAPTYRPTTRITTPSSITTPKVSSVCTESGFAANPKDCTSFYVCVNLGNGVFQPHQFYCPSGLYWDQSGLFCNYASQVNCNA